MQKRIIYISVLSALLTACGGGGSFDTPTSTPSDKKDNDGTAVIDPSLIKTGKEDKTGTESPSKDEKKKQGEVEKVKAEAEKAKAEAEKAKAEAEKAKAEAEKNKKDESNTQQPPATETPKVAFKVATQEQIEAHNKLGEESGSDGDTIDNSKVEYGYSMPSPFTGGLTHALIKENERQANASIDINKAHSDNTPDNYDTITFVNSPEAKILGGGVETKNVTITKDGFAEKPYATTERDYPLSGNISDKIKGNMVLVIDNNTYDTLKMVEFDNTKAGSVYNANSIDSYANLFYRGKNPSQSLPTNGTAKYDGSWQVARKVEINASDAIAGYGNSDVNTRAPAEFTVKFDDKSITGTLHKNLAKNQAFAYTLSDGKITGNTFTATANSIKDEATNSDTAKVTGGFFGEEGSELAGKLISENAFGVFAAKQTESEFPPPKQYSQGKILTGNFSGEFDGNIGTTDGTKKLDNIDELNKITINDTEVDLLEVAKTENYPVSQGSIFANTDSLPLQFTRFGSVLASVYSGNTPNTFSYFYQGQLTQDVPTSGNATYHGSWIGNGKSSDKNIATTFSMTKDRDGKIEFVADFDKKTLDGQFKTETGNEAMTLKGVTFDGNTFKGQATITANGLSTNKTGSREFIKGTVEVSGAFFGPQANELGGEFHKEDKNFAGVFAGKQIQK